MCHQNLQVLACWADVAKCRFKWAYNPTGDQNSAKVRGGSRPLLFSFIVLPITIVPYLQYLGRSLEVGLMKTLSRLMRTWRWSKPHFSRMSCGSIMYYDVDGLVWWDRGMYLFVTMATCCDPCLFVRTWTQTTLPWETILNEVGEHQEGGWMRFLNFEEMT